MRRLGVFLVTIAVIVGLVGCVYPPPFIPEYDLTISRTEGGSVSTPGEGTFDYSDQEVVELVAEAEGGYRFVEWTGDVSTVADTNAASTTVIMNGNYAIIANFVAQYVLTANSTDGGHVTTPGEGMFTYDVDTIVSLIATPVSRYRFLEWTGDVIAVANVSAASTSITMDGDYSVTASFEKETDARSFFRGVLDPEGSWEYAWDHEQVIYELVVETMDRFITNAPKEGPRWGGVSGGSEYTQNFVHIWFMIEQAGGDERRVIVAAWGNTHVFEAGVFPDTQENYESIVKPAFGKSSDEVSRHIQAMIELSEDVIRGYTADYHF